MSDDLHDLFSSAVPSPPPPTGQADAARAYARRRRRLRTASVVLIVVAIVVPSALAARHGGDDGPDPSDGLSCSGGVVVTNPSGEPRVPAYESPRDAVEGWAGPLGDERIVMDGTRAATLVDADGGVRAKVRITSTRVDLGDSEPTAWSVDGSEVCDDEAASGTWAGAELLRCDPPLEVVRARIKYPDGGLDRRFPTEPEGLRVERGDQVGKPSLTAGARSGDATTVTSRADFGPAIVAREVRVADRWRVDRIAACLPGPPNLDGFGHLDRAEWVMIPVRVGHCWVAPIEYGGRSWAVTAEDDFGGGGGVPPHWFGYGLPVIAGGVALRYFDLGGADLTFLEEGKPGTTTPSVCV